MNIFLKAKHWQLFLLIFGIPMLFQFVMMGTMIARISSQNTPDPAFMFSYIKFFPIIMIFFMGTFFGWFWSIAIGLQRKIPAQVKMKVKKFKILFFVPVVYIASMMLMMIIMMNGFMEKESLPNPGFIGGFAALIVPLHIFSMFCVFYSLYFVAKTFKTVELQREVSFSDFAGEFFMIWFYPIGIWIIQPKINQMAKV
jgi:hypothetical protein